jgi:hypothetical protein
MALSPGSVRGVSVMRKSNWTPSIVPRGDDQNVYLVADDLGRSGRIGPEADLERTDLEAVILALLEGQYKNPIRVVSHSTPPNTGRVSADVAQELRRRCDLLQRDVPFFVPSLEQVSTTALNLMRVKPDDGL